MGRKTVKVGVKIVPRKEVLDTQGRAVEKILNHHDMKVKSCRVGRYVELDIDDNNKDAALKKAKTIIEFVLYNNLIEDYTMEVINES